MNHLLKASGIVALISVIASLNLIAKAENRETKKEEEHFANCYLIAEVI